MIKAFLRVAAALVVGAWCLSGATALAQSTAQPVLPGLLVTSGCPAGYTACYAPYSATNPLPVTPVAGGTPQDVNITKVAGAAVATGHGAASGALRVELPTDGTGVVTANQGGAPWSENITQIAGASIATGHGTAAGAIRVELPTDGTGLVSAAQSGAWNITNITGTVSLPTGASTAANQAAPQAPVAFGSATATTSELVGCQYLSTLPSPATSNQGALTCGAKGSLNVQLFGKDSTNGVTVSSATDGQAGQTGMFDVPQPQIFNGSTWDKAFTCSSLATVSVTAGNTTQIVGLSGSTVIRVCSVSLGISANGTVALTSGTGTNCGTPANAMAAIPLNTGAVWAQSAPSGGALYRGSAGGEFCVTAVTGNVTGFVTYAQY